MIYFDGKWHMYDVLFDNYDVTDSNTMAEKGYYFAFIEGMPIAGDGLDPALAGIDVGGMLVTSCYYQGNFVTLVYGRNMRLIRMEIFVKQHGWVEQSGIKT